jgi:hypothetical protein
MRKNMIIGERYGKLTVTSLPYRKDNLVGRAMYVDVVCDCGTKKYIKAVSLRSNVTKSCGCLSVETTIQTHTTHGLSKHPLMSIWSGMVQRCTNKNSLSYSNYGGRGVKICKLWRNNFIEFYKWAIANGWKRGLELDKDIKGNGLLYSPKNCCFIDYLENARCKRSIKLSMEDAENIRLTAPWGRHTAKKLSLKYNVSVSAIYSVINNETWA